MRNSALVDSHYCDCHVHRACIHNAVFIHVTVNAVFSLTHSCFLQSTLVTNINNFRLM